MKLSPLQTAALAFYALPADERPAGRPATATIKSLTARGLVEVVMRSRTSGEYVLTEAGRAEVREEQLRTVAREAVARELVEEPAPAKPSPRPRYTVRKQSSGRTFSETFYVYDLQAKGRVSVHASRSREAAQHDADGLNATEAQHLANLADPQWIAERDAKLAAQGLAVNAEGDLVRLEDVQPEPEVPAVGATVRFRSDFGAVGASGATFVVDTEPTVDNTRADRPTVVGLATVGQARPGYRLAYVRDLVAVEGRTMPATYAEPRKGTNAHVAWERGYAWSEWTKLPRSERMAETLRAEGTEPTEQQLANLRLLDAPVADRLAALRAAR